jgi:Ser/Thr protein kinase RdoA (MazF antagonist)
VHLDITDDNVVWARDGNGSSAGVIDFGDLLRTWRIADLSVTCAALLHTPKATRCASCRRCRPITPSTR